MHPGHSIGTVYLYRSAIDFRKSIGGLSALVEQELGLNPGLAQLPICRNIFKWPFCIMKALCRASLQLRESQTGTTLRSMRVIAVSTLRAFWERHPDAEQPLKAWYEEATHASWTQPADIKAQYRSASVLKNRRVVFNIKGNDYRLIVAVAYKLQIVYVKFVGTHKEYDAVDAETVEMA